MEKALLNLSIPSERFPLIQPSLFKLPIPRRAFTGFKPLFAFAIFSPTSVAAAEPEQTLQRDRHSILLDKLRSKHLKNAAKGSQTSPRPKKSPGHPQGEDAPQNSKNQQTVFSFEELGLCEEAVTAVEKMNISVPTEIQCIGIPAVLERKNVVLGSHTGSGKTLAFLLPIVQLLRMEEASIGIQTKPRRPRAIVLCPTRELSEQVFHVAKFIGHHARFRSTMVSGGGRMRPQEDALNTPVDMIVGTPGRVLKHFEDGNMVYGDIKYLVLDEADTMFDRGFGPDIRKFLRPLKNRASKSCDQGYQTVLVTATMTKAVQKLIDEEFHGIEHLHTSTFHKKIETARHDFIKLSSSENKLEALIQVLKPSLSTGNKVMIFCNTLSSSRAVDHFLGENNFYTVNYHGEVPAEQRFENLQKFKTEGGDSPALVCTDLAARGLDLDVDHVIMFDFPMNSIDYLHRTGRTARMGAKGRVTSLVGRRDLALAAQIEEAMRKNQSLDSVGTDKAQMGGVKGKTKTLGKSLNQRGKTKPLSVKTLDLASRRKGFGVKSGKFGASASKPSKPGSASGGKKETERSPEKGQTRPSEMGNGRRFYEAQSAGSKLGIVEFRGRSSRFD